MPWEPAWRNLATARLMTVGALLLLRTLDYVKAEAVIDRANKNTP